MYFRDDCLRHKRICFHGNFVVLLVWKEKTGRVQCNNLWTPLNLILILSTDVSVPCVCVCVSCLFNNLVLMQIIAALTPLEQIREVPVCLSVTLLIMTLQSSSWEGKMCWSQVSRASSLAAWCHTERCTCGCGGSADRDTITVITCVLFFPVLNSEKCVGWMLQDDKSTTLVALVTATNRRFQTFMFPEFNLLCLQKHL